MKHSLQRHYAHASGLICALFLLNSLNPAGAMGAPSPEGNAKPKAGSPKGLAFSEPAGILLIDRKTGRAVCAKLEGRSGRSALPDCASIPQARQALAQASLTKEVNRPYRTAGLGIFLLGTTVVCAAGGAVLGTGIVELKRNGGGHARLAIGSGVIGAGAAAGATMTWVEATVAAGFGYSASGGASVFAVPIALCAVGAGAGYYAVRALIRPKSDFQ
ncbi:MAG: hypothetical protein KDH09_09315 [Chrysiogenetes bacterium]|nr:hypothetical protein [Chrysiogenetes bacterium]